MVNYLTIGLGLEKLLACDPRFLGSKILLLFETT